MSSGFPPRRVPLPYAGRFPLMSLLKHDSFEATPYLVKERAVPTVGNPQLTAIVLTMESDCKEVLGRAKQHSFATTQAHAEKGGLAPVRSAH